MDHTCTCNDSTSFEYKTHSPETEIVANLLKLENSWNHIKWTYFVAGINYLEPLCIARWSTMDWNQFRRSIVCYILEMILQIKYYSEEYFEYAGKKNWKYSSNFFFNPLCNNFKDRCSLSVLCALCLEVILLAIVEIL